jgi:excinuclease ABC subunit B
MSQTQVADSKKFAKNYYAEDETPSLAADPVVAYMPLPQLEKLASQTKKQMEKAAKDLDFMEAARLRDEWQALVKVLEDKKK